MSQQDFRRKFAESVTIDPPRYTSRKRAVDFAIAVVIAIPALPLLVILCVLIRLNSKGAPIYAQRRVGYQGGVFTMYKLRSMYIDAEAMSGPAWSTEDDPRVTWVGRWLRKLHLDEIPQLWNVLRGEMSFTGPRPERPVFVKKLIKRVPGYLNRLAVRPGVTGLAQINLPPDTDVASVKRKQQLDLLYIETASLWLDVRMLLATSIRMVGIPGHWATVLMGLSRDVRKDDISLADTQVDLRDTIPMQQGFVPASIHESGDDLDSAIHLANPAAD